jgi:HEAT repeat protein
VKLSFQLRLVELLLACLASALAVAGCGGSGETGQIKSHLRSGNASVRLKAVAEAEAQPDAGLRKELLRMFEDDSELPIIRGAAGMALGRLRDPALLQSVLRQIPGAVAAARSTNSARQMDGFMLGKALATYGPESIPTLAPLLKDKRPEVVAWVIAMHGMFRRNDQALHVLSGFVKHPEPLYRRSAVYGLALLFHPQAEPFLIRGLDDVDPEVRYHAAWGLENYGTAAALVPLDRHLGREKQAQVKQELQVAIAAVKARGQAPAAAGPANLAPATPTQTNPHR